MGTLSLQNVRAVIEDLNCKLSDSEIQSVFNLIRPDRVITKKYSWKEMIIQLSDDGDLKRNLKTETMYQLENYTLSGSWLSSSDYCQHKYLGYPIELVLIERNGEQKLLKSTNKNQKEFQNESNKFVLRKNPYPYHFENGITHYIIWSSNLLSAEECKANVQELFPTDSYDIIMFESPQQVKSIPDIFHVHVFIRNKAGATGNIDTLGF